MIEPTADNNKKNLHLVIRLSNKLKNLSSGSLPVENANTLEQTTFSEEEISNTDSLLSQDKNRSIEGSQYSEILESL